LESDHRNPTIKTNKRKHRAREKEREKEKKYVASKALRRKETAMHIYAIRDEQP
jgi:hypothetical protein